MFGKGFGKHQNRKVDMEEFAKQEVRATRINCVDSQAVYVPPVLISKYCAFYFSSLIFK